MPGNLVHSVFATPLASSPPTTSIGMVVTASVILPAHLSILTWNVILNVNQTLPALLPFSTFSAPRRLEIQMVDLAEMQSSLLAFAI